MFNVQRYDFVAIRPEAAMVFQQKNIPYLKLDDFYEAQFLLGRYDQILSAEWTWAMWIDQYLRHSVVEFAEADFRPALAHFFYLKIMLDQLLICSHALTEFLRKRTPSEIYYVQKPTTSIRWNLLFQESLYLRLVPEIAESLEIPIRILQSPSDSDGPEESVPAPIGWLRANVRRLLPRSGKYQLAVLRQCGLQALMQYWKSLPAATVPVLMLGNPGYDVIALLPHLVARGVRPVFDSCLVDREKNAENLDTQLRRTLHSLWPDCAQNIQFAALFETLGCPNHAVIDQRLMYWWTQIIPEDWELFKRAREMFTSRSFAGVLATQAHAHREVPIAMAARSNGLPLTVCQHGIGPLGKNSHFAWTDMVLATNMLTYGLSASSNLQFSTQSIPNDTFAQLVAVGSARLDCARRRASPKRTRSLRQRLMRTSGGKPLILYIPTMFNGHDDYLGSGHLPDIVYFEMQQRVIDRFCQHPEVHLVYKNFVGADRVTNPISTYIGLKLSNYTLIDDVKLVDLVWAVDVIICDYPGTALLEASLTNKPILAYVDRTGLNVSNNSWANLEKRLMLSETRNEFVAAIERFLAEPVLSEVGCPDDGFLKGHATSTNDGQSAARAAKAIARIVCSFQETMQYNAVGGH